MPTRLTGTPSFASLGVQAPQPPNIVAIGRAPTVNDFATFNTGDLWINTASLSNSPPTAPRAEDVWMLVSKNKRINNATWINFTGGNALLTLTGNVGGAVPGDVNQNINTLGDGVGITVTGNPGTNTLTWSLVGGGLATQSYHTDDNNVEVPIGTVVIPAVGANGQINILGGSTAPNAYTNINTRQGVDIHTVDVDLNNSIGQPNTTANGLQGMYALGPNNNFSTDRFMHNYGTRNTFLGKLAGNLTLNVVNSTDNTCIGAGAGFALVGSGGGLGGQNTLVGSNCGPLITNGHSDVFVGNLSGAVATTASDCTGVGTLSLTNLTTGVNDTSVGFNSGVNYTIENNNTVVGVSNVGRVGENNVIRIGVIGGDVGTENIFIGRDTGSSAYTVATAKNNVFVGSTAGGTTLTTGHQNTVVGSFSGGGGVTTGSNNSFLGYQAGLNYTGAESQNICIGSGATGNSVGKAGEVGTIWIGSNPSGATQNIFIGNGAGNVAYTTANNFTALGTSAAASVTTAIHSVALGNGALNAGTSCDNSVAVGSTALALVTTGVRNSAVGAASGAALLTGNDNCYFGNIAGNAHVGAERDNIIIGASVPGVAAETNALHIGAATGNAAGVGNLNKAFICGIRGITTGVNDAIAVLVDSANQLGTVSSTREVKANIKKMGSYSDALYKLRPVTFNYRQHTPDVISVGLIAEEVEEVMPRLVAYQDNKPMSVKYHDLPAMLLNELQKLEKRVSELEKGCKCQTSV